MSINSMFSIGKDSLVMNQTALTIVSDNIANVNVEGYAKQRVEQETIDCNLPVKGKPGLYFTSMGARIADITRYTDNYLDSQIRDSSSEAAFFKELQDGIDGIENLLNELNGNNGITTALSEFYSAINDMAANPTDLATRAVVVQKAQNIATKFNQYSTAIAEQRNMLIGTAGDHASVENSIAGSSITAINDLLENIAALNKNIANLSTGTSKPNSILDQQAGLLEQLSQYIPIEVSQNNTNNTFTVKFNGQELVSGGYVKAEFGIAATTDVNNPMQITLTDTDDRVTDVTKDINSGSLGALIQLGTSDSEYFSYTGVQNQLDTLAHEFAQAFNEIQTYVDETKGIAALSVTIDADGNKILKAPTFDADGNLVSSNDPIFESTDGEAINASNITINKNILKDPYGLAAAYGEINTTTGAIDNPLAVGDTRAALEMFAQRNTVKASLKGNTFESYMTHITNDIGVKKGTLDSLVDTSSAELSQLGERRSSLRGVNLDEELIDLVKYQRAYEASARIFNVASSIMESLVNLGR